MSEEADKLNEQLDILVKSRGYTRARATRLVTQANDSDELTARQRASLIEKLECVNSELQDYNKQTFPLYIKLKLSNAQLDSHVLEEETYYDQVIDAIASLKAVPEAPTSSATSAQINRKLELPKMPLPTFSNERHESLKKFVTSFEAIILKHNLSSYEKFIYLRNQLAKGPRVLIDSLDNDKQLYENAKELLEEAFGNETQVKHDLIKRISNLKFGMNDDPYMFIGELKNVISSTKSQNLTVDDFLQFFAWEAMNSKFQDHLVNITNNNKPSLEEIEKHVFEATERFKKQNTNAPYSNNKASHKTDSSKQQNETSSAAVNVQTNKFTCPLCSADGSDKFHKLYSCPKYDSPRGKVNKLKSIKACIKCGYCNHETKACKYKFASQCRNCNGDHMSFLCLKSSSPPSATESSSGRTTVSAVEASTGSETTQGVSLVEVNHSTTLENVALPTFTAELVSGNRSKQVRIFKDGGSQLNFINQTLADELNLKTVVPEMSLSIKGFVAQRSINTKVVELNLQFGDKSAIIPAVCIDEIKTSFKVNNLSEIITNFENRGYDLADKQLHPDTSVVNNIQVILGSQSNHVFPCTDVVFGDEKTPSIFIKTPIGAMLSGGVDRMRDNIKYLPFNLCQTTVSSVDANTIPITDEELLCESVNDKTDKIFDTQYESMFNVPVTNPQPDMIKQIDVPSNAGETQFSETDEKVINFVVSNTERDETGRLIMPLPWNSKNAHLLGKNYNMSQQILRSTFNKLSKSPEQLKLYNDVFKEQRAAGIIEKIDDVEQFMHEHPECSFMPHMGVFKSDNQTTKCRVVYLSNLSQKDRNKELTVSHNMAMLSGPSLNHKITTAVMHLRFDSSMLIFDLKKAFLSIGLRETDQNRLMFLWFNDIEKGDFSVAAYRSLRLSFGLRASPMILMLSMFIILILSTSSDDEITEMKRNIYNNLYVDNGSYTSCDVSKLHSAYDNMIPMFRDYGFELQQFYTNDKELQNKIDVDAGEVAPDMVKLFGMMWDRTNDEICVNKISLNADATTRREMLASLNAVYDIYNVYAPVLLRARIFMQKLQCDQSLNWDTAVSENVQREWHNIACQANKTPVLTLERCVGPRDAEYELIVYTDASRQASGSVVYLRDTNTGKVSFMSASSKLLSQNMRKKSIPSLELFAISMGLEFVLDISDALSGPQVVTPIKITKIHLMTDSMVCLQWLTSYAHDFDKLKNLSVFVKNNLRKIDESCAKFPVTFRHTAGQSNPADLATKPHSYNLLSKSTYFTGPEDLADYLDGKTGDIIITIPNPQVRMVDEVPESVVNVADTSPTLTSAVSLRDVSSLPDPSITVPPLPSVAPRLSQADATSPSVDTHPAGPTAPAQCPVLPCSGPTEPHGQPCDSNPTAENNPSISNPTLAIKYSSFNFAVNVFKIVHRFINKLKIKIKNKFPHINCVPDDANFFKIASNRLIHDDQRQHFSDVFAYFKSDKKLRKNMPEIVAKMNLYVDENDLIRVKSKFSDQKLNPILLPKDSHLTRLIIREFHDKCGHGGTYSVLKAMKPTFHVIHYFSVIKKVLQKCVICKRFNSRPIRLNQNCYREIRVNPTQRPFSDVYLDYIGPFTVKLNNENTKVWLLIITCMWSRAINLLLCRTADTEDFLRAIQTHVYSYGMFSNCVSDLGSQIQSGANVISNFLNDPESHSFFQTHNVKPVKFQHYAKGNSALGSLVEICVKQTKFLIYKSIKTVILDYFQFELLIAKAVSLINKRPIAFKDGLRAPTTEDVPMAISPEMLIKGYETCSLTVMPQLQYVDDNDDDNSNDYTSVPHTDRIKTNFTNLNKVRKRLVDLYHTEFLSTLMVQAVDKKDRYKPVKHDVLRPGDIVLLVEKNTKQYHYPMGRVESVEKNSLGEVTAAKIIKGGTREKVYRHVSSLILLLSYEPNDDSVSNDERDLSTVVKDNNPKSRPKRKAAGRCLDHLHALVADGAL